MHGDRRNGPGRIEQSVFEQDGLVIALQLADRSAGVSEAKGELVRDAGWLIRDRSRGRGGVERSSLAQELEGRRGRDV
jgi:hypothetical protein